MTEATRIIAIRHGETAWNVDTRFQGHLDIGLNDTGRWQAQRVANALVPEPIDAIYSSDLLRAWDTAISISVATRRPLQTDEGLRERGFGRFEGNTFQEIEVKWPDEALTGASASPTLRPRAVSRWSRFVSASPLSWTGLPRPTSARRLCWWRTAA